jgi:hypothetical protein
MAGSSSEAPLCAIAGRVAPNAVADESETVSKSTAATDLAPRPAPANILPVNIGSLLFECLSAMLNDPV